MFYSIKIVDSDRHELPSTKFHFIQLNDREIETNKTIIDCQKPSTKFIKFIMIFK